MALPLSRNETPAIGTQVKSATNIDLQDAVINRRHGSIVLPVGFNGAHVTSGTLADNADGWSSNGGATDWIEQDIDLPVGTNITQLLVYVYQSGTTPITVELGYYVAGVATWAPVSSKAMSAPVGYKSDDVVTAGAHVTVTGRSYKLRMKSASQAGDIFKFAELTIEKST